MGTLREIGYIEFFKIRTHEIDINKQIKIPSLVQLLQEASMSNAIKLKVSVWDLEDKSLSWVLVKKRLNINRLPILGETIEVITYPSGFERLFAYRDFIVKDSSGKILVSASSTWILMDTKTRKITSPDLNIPTPTDIEPLPRASFNFSKLNSEIDQTSFRVGWYDLDWNEHVNNVFIFRCVLECLPDNVLQEKKISAINIQFKAESFWKDKLISNVQSVDELNTSHSIIRKEDNKVIALANVEWN